METKTIQSTATTEVIGIKQSDFISPQKGIELSMVSTGIWLFTGILFKMIDAILNNQINYAAFCLFVSFILSAIAGVYISRKLYKKRESIYLLATFLNILLIYTSANGIHAVYSNTSGKSDSSVAKSGFIPFIDSRPWLPDGFSKQKIEELEEENSELLVQVKSTREQSGNSSGLDESRTRLQRINDSLVNVINNINAATLTGDSRTDALLKENNKLRTELTNLGNNFDNQQLLLDEKSAEVARLEKEITGLRSENQLLKNRERELLGNINQLQNELKSCQGQLANSSSSSTITTLNNRIRDLQSSLATCNADLDAKELELEKCLKGKNDNSSATIASLNRELQKQKTLNASLTATIRNIESLRVQYNTAKKSGALVKIDLEWKKTVSTAISADFYKKLFETAHSIKQVE